MKRRTFLKTALAGVGAAALAKPALAQSSDSRVLKFVPQADLAIIDPYRSTAYVTRNHGYLVFDTLYGVDENLVAQPQMVQGHTIEQDGKLWRLTLREGLRFHDDTPVLARDVVASIRRWARNDGYGDVVMQRTNELSAASDRIIEFRLKQPFSLLPDALAKLPGYMPAIMPERLASSDPNTPITEMVGSGPFRFVANERVPGAKVVYEKFANYVPRPGAPLSRTAGAKIAYLDRIEWNVMPDQSTALSALLAGEVDWLETPGFDLLPLLRQDPNINVDLKDTMGNVGNMRFNQTSAPFDNPEIRRVIARAVNQADFMAATAGNEPGAWKDGVGFFSPGTPLAEGLPPLAHEPDIEKSKRDLIAAGYKGERVVLLAATDYPAMNAMAQVGADLLKKLGMNVDFQALDWGTVQQRRSSREPVERGGWSLFFTFMSGAEAANPALNQFLRGNGFAGLPGWATSPQLESLRTEWLNAPDLTAQKAVCAKIQRQADQDMPYIPLGQYFQPFAYRKNISGMPTGFAAFYNVKKA